MNGRNVLLFWVRFQYRGQPSSKNVHTNRSCYGPHKRFIYYWYGQQQLFGRRDACASDFTVHLIYDDVCCIDYRVQGHLGRLLDRDRKLSKLWRGIGADAKIYLSSPQ